MSNVIKAIPTLYKGVEFRSKLEARVAMFLDLGKIPWTYEPERLGNEKEEEYNPDFYLPETDDWIEVKGKRPGYEQEILKASRFVTLDGPIKRLIIISEIPDPSIIGMPHFPCYYSRKLLDGRNFIVEAGWYFFQDTAKGHFEGHISSASYRRPPIYQWNYDGYQGNDFDISPVSDTKLIRERKIRELIMLEAELKQPANLDYDSCMKNQNSTFFSALSSARRADFTMRKV